MGTPLQAGDVLAGKFRVERVLGEGGMGVVVAATHLDLDSPVALKFLRGKARETPDVETRFRREARAAARLRSEHIARVFDVGSLDDGSPYIVSELLEGRDLSTLLEERGPLPADEATDYVLQACAGIAEAHGKGIVHRDLKPSNLFLTKRADGTPLIKLLDFGIAKTPATWEGSDPTQTDTSQVLGSPAFMSPEQMRSAKRVDARADIWALGAILYALLTQSEPFRANTFPELCIKILQESPEPPREELDEGLWSIITTCLAKERQERYGDVAVLASELAPFASAEGERRASAIAQALRAAASESHAGNTAGEGAESRAAPPTAEGRTEPSQRGRVGAKDETKEATHAPLGKGATLASASSAPSSTTLEGAAAPRASRSDARPPRRTRRLATLGAAATLAAAIAVGFAFKARSPDPPRGESAASHSSGDAALATPPRARAGAIAPADKADGDLRDADVESALIGPGLDPADAGALGSEGAEAKEPRQAGPNARPRDRQDPRPARESARSERPERVDDEGPAPPGPEREGRADRPDAGAAAGDPSGEPDEPPEIDWSKQTRQ